ASLAVASCMRGTPPASGQVTVENGARPGQFAVANHGPGAVELLRKVTVDQRDDGKWTATEAEVSLVSACSNKTEASTVRLATGQTLKVAPWDGKTCDGQCPRACRANVYLGPGEFR